MSEWKDKIKNLRSPPPDPLAKTASEFNKMNREKFKVELLPSKISLSPEVLPKKTNKKVSFQL
jgi:hypothetical protein